jgi:SAM-dependent methyltransferase
VIHRVAGEGFNDPADYEAARPSYPADAVDWFVEHLGLRGATRVVDLAAGTGKLTRLLSPVAGDALVAVEPVAGMRATLHRLLPGVPVVAATAEALPFADASLDAITVAQAWHWFDHDAATAEAARVLRPGGRLGLAWNARDRSVSWVDAVWSIMDRVEKRAPWRDHDQWRDSARRPMPGFGPLQTAEFRHVQRTTVEGMVQRVASVSHVAVLPDAERSAVLDEVRALLESHPDVGAVLEVPYRVDCFWAERR